MRVCSGASGTAQDGDAVCGCRCISCSMQTRLAHWYPHTGSSVADTAAPLSWEYPSVSTYPCHTRARAIRSPRRLRFYQIRLRSCVLSKILLRSCETAYRISRLRVEAVSCDEIKHKRMAGRRLWSGDSGGGA
eukprot:scaffold28067_cov162-Isochrysis_galbana.AAC.3